MAVSFNSGAKANKSRVRRLAAQFGISMEIAKQIIDAYCKDLEDTLIAGDDVNVPGVFSIKVHKDANGNNIYRGRVSVALKTKENQIGGYTPTFFNGDGL